MNFEYTILDGKSSPPLELYAVQGEAGARTFKLNVKSKRGPSPVGASSKAYIFVEKNDKTLVVISCEAEAGSVTFTLPLQACTCPGINKVYLQILEGTSETRWDNLRLYVEPCNLEDAVESTTDLGDLGSLLDKVDSIDEIMDFVVSTAKELERILEKYSDELRPLTFGVGDNDCQFITGMDPDGNMFLADGYHQNGNGSMFSVDYGASWQRFTYGSDSKNMTAQAFIAGKKLLVMDKNYLCWGSVNGNTVDFEEPISHNLYDNVNPVFKGRGIYAGGKYLFLLNVKEYEEHPVGQNMYYLAEGGASPVQVKFPNERMEATAVSFDPISGKFIAAGRYAMALEDDEYNHKAWAAVSTNLSSWEMVYEDSDDKAVYFLSAEVYKGKFYLAPFGSFENSLWLITVDTQTNAQNSVIVHKENAFRPAEISAVSMGIGALNSEGLLAFSEDGQTFQYFQTQVVGGTLSRLSGWERYFLLGSGNKLAVYRMDLVGENLIENLEKIQESYEQALQSVEDTENAIRVWETYDPEKNYILLNKVSYMGSSYVNIKPCRGVLPTNKECWLLIAEKGDDGKQGPEGPPGEKGETGEPGTGIKIKGKYESFEQLESEVPSPEISDNYFVGNSYPYDVYTYTERGWINSGPLQGAPGPQGEPGRQGDPGPQGEPGIQGKAASVSVGTVQTGEPGAEAAVINRGTSSEAVFDFVIPRGEQGPEGPPGPAGTPIKDIVDVIYPIGSLFLSTNNVNPGTFLQDTVWELFGAGRTLVGVDIGNPNFNSAGKTGGAQSVNLSHGHSTQGHVLTAKEIASHKHSVYLNTQSNTHSHAMKHTHGPGDMMMSSDGDHYHGVTYRNGTTPITMDGGSSGYVLQWTANKGSGNNENIRTTNKGSHTHSLLGQVSYYSGNTQDSTHSHLVNGDTDVQTGGGGQAHNHGNTGNALGETSLMNPYVTCYFWKRTA